ncbi:hypothetical protein [Chamaesiphon sp.]|uniref:hypothetical protein n=1 Tax=Chamaesiphon sp. TaxID=2814140 RepID=UPI003593A373
MYKYIAALSAGKTVLWCYLIWYLVAVVNHFDSSAAIWLNSLGISALIGIALMLSIGGTVRQTDPWQTFRLFLMPFCVSSFSALIKNKGYILIFPPTASEAVISVGLCVAFVMFVVGLKHLNK